MPEKMIPVYQFHIAFTLRKYSFLSIGKVHQYTETMDEEQVSNALKSLKKLITGKTRFALVVSGTFTEQLQKHPKLIDAIKAGIKKDQIVLLASTYHISLASLYSPALFKEQIKMHQAQLEKIFDYRPRIFYNTAALYLDKLGTLYQELGIEAAIAPISEWHLNGRASTGVFQDKDGIKLLLLAEDGLNAGTYRIGTVNVDAIKSQTDRESAEVYRVPQPIYNKKLISGKTLSSNALQHAVHQKIIYLKKKLKKQKRSELYHALSLFTSLDFFDILTKTDDQSNREPYEQYTNLMNVLTDFQWVNKI